MCLWTLLRHIGKIMYYFVVVSLFELLG